MENALFYPFYVLKTREQADNRALGKSALETSKAHLRTLLKEQGVRGMYRGFVSSNLTAFPAYAVYMGVYTAAKEELGYEAGEKSSNSPFNYSSVYAPFLAGLIADGASVALYVPGDVIVQRLQLKDSPYSGFADACKQIYRTDGMAGFFRGIGATFITSGIASGIWWLIYESVKNEMYVSLDRKEKLKKLTDPVVEVKAVDPTTLETPSMWQQFTSVNRVPQVLAGFIAGTFTSVMINPLDVVKTRLQVQDTYGQQAHDATKKAAAAAGTAAAATVEPPPPTKRYKNMFHGLYRIYIDDGIRGYWRGVMPKIVSRGPLSAMSSLLYEVVLHLSKTDEAKRLEAQYKFQLQ